MKHISENTEEKKMGHIRLSKMEPFLAKKEIGDFIVKSVLNFDKTGCVIGLSGGIDSSVTATLINDAFKSYNQNAYNKLELVGYILPSKLNSDEDKIKGTDLADFLGIRYKVQSLEPLIEAKKITNPNSFKTDFNKGNMISRLRAGVLHDYAADENKLVAGTGNKDEDYGIGYYTLFGDGAVHISPIGNLPKRLVYEMGKFLGIDKRILESEPSAGLEPNQTDFKDLGYGYDLVELVIAGLDQGIKAKEMLYHPQVEPIARKCIIEYAKKYSSSKFSSVDELLEDIYDRHKIAPEKASLVSPKVAPITFQVI